MNAPRDPVGKGAAASIGIVLGAGLVFGLGALGRGETPSADRPDASGIVTSPAPSDSEPSPQGPPTPRPPGPRANRTFLAWAPGSLPSNTESQVDGLPPVRNATTVYAGLDWLEGSRERGAKWRRSPRGFAIPFEMAAIQPREYAPFAQPEDRDLVADLGPGEALLARTERGLRGAGRGLKLDLGERTVRVVGTVDDRTTNGYEALVAGPPPDEWVRADRFLLARLKGAGGSKRVRKAVQSLMPAGQPLQTRTGGENPFLRYGDAVLPQLLIKDAFGEFAARPTGGTLALEPGWERENIRTRSVPILGRVRCHRLLFPQLIGALRDLQSQGLAHAIHPEQFGGCFYPRFISLNPDGRLSHHSWGIAVDLNAPENDFGTKADLDMGVVEIFEERWGFTWGGRWVVPDGMHFEWVKFP